MALLRLGHCGFTKAMKPFPNLASSIPCGRYSQFLLSFHDKHGFSPPQWAGLLSELSKLFVTPMLARYPLLIDIFPDDLPGRFVSHYANPIAVPQNSPLKIYILNCRNSQTSSPAVILFIL